MRNIFFVVLIFVFLAAAPAGAAQKRTEGIVAVVNSTAISRSDLDDRMRMILSSTKLPDVKEVRDRVRAQILSSLVEEQIKMQESSRLKIQIPDSDIEQAIGEIGKQNGMTLDEFKTMFKERGLPLKTLRAQIRAQLAWMKVVSRQIRPKIEVSETDIDDELGILKAKLGQSEFLLAEIFLPLDRPGDEPNLKEMAGKLIEKIREEPKSFPVLAQQFSRAATAAQGGNMGWIALEGMPADIVSKLEGAQPGTVIGPFKDTMGFHILLVRERRTRAEENLPSRDEIADKIGMERLDRMQRRYYLDLRSSSFVEIRL